MKFFGALIAVLVAIALELRMKHIFGVAPDFALAALLSLGGVIGVSELLVLVLLAAFFMNWQPALSWEIVWLATLPFIFMFFFRLFPLQRWAANVITVVLGTLCFVLLIDPGFIARSTLGFLELWAGAVTFGVVLFHLFQSAFLPRREQGAA